MNLSNIIMSLPVRVRRHIVFSHVSVCPSDCPSQNLVNTTPPTVLARLYLNFADVLSRSEDVHEIWLQSWD